MLAVFHINFHPVLTGLESCVTADCYERHSCGSLIILYKLQMFYLGISLLCHTNRSVSVKIRRVTFSSSGSPYFVSTQLVVLGPSSIRTTWFYMAEG
jgi:hypothetical protein